MGAIEELREGGPAAGMTLHRDVWAHAKNGEFDDLKALLHSLPIEELECKYSLAAVLGAAMLVNERVCAYSVLYGRVKARMSTVSPEQVQVLEEYFKPWVTTE